jgi:predicted phosphodiesterase
MVAPLNKVILIADTHFGARGDNQSLLSHMEKFHNTILFPTMEKTGIREVIHLGDLVDKRASINFNTARRMRTNFLDRLIYGQVHFLIGNHDTFYKNTNSTNALKELLGGYNQFKIYERPNVVQIANNWVLMLPWICADNEAVSIKAIEMSKGKIDLCFGHLELTGFEMHNKGSVAQHGMDYKLFEHFKLVMSGHFHHPSQRGNIRYLGAPYQFTWSDYNDPRGFHILDLDTHELTFIENPYVMFHKIFYDDKDKLMSVVLPEDLTRYQGSYVKIIVRNKTNPFWFDTLIDHLDKVGVVDISVVEDNFNLQLETDDEIIDQAEDTITILKKYVDQMGLETNKDKLEAVLKNLYDEAMNMQV